ncbi:MAG: FadR/GntR family transcriptional regulator [Rhodospirillales bacterium]
MDIDNVQGIGTGPQTERTYQKIARHLKQRIQAEGWSTGDRLPSERVLATDFGVSRTSLREALLALEIAGIVEIRVGSGVFILPHENNVETASHSF